MTDIYEIVETLREAVFHKNVVHLVSNYTDDSEVEVYSRPLAVGLVREDGVPSILQVVFEGSPEANVFRGDALTSLTVGIWEPV